MYHITDGLYHSLKNQRGIPIPTCFIIHSHSRVGPRRIRQTCVQLSSKGLEITINDKGYSHLLRKVFEFTTMSPSPSDGNIRCWASCFEQNVRCLSKTFCDVNPWKQFNMSGKVRNIRFSVLYRVECVPSIEPNVCTVLVSPLVNCWCVLFRAISDKVNIWSVVMNSIMRLLWNRVALQIVFRKLEFWKINLFISTAWTRMKRFNWKLQL
jgi:hypothetical protein